MDRFGRFLKFLARSTKRVAVLIVGSVVVAAGLAMLVLPGPGLLVIILGLAILATEFAWAEYLLHKAKEKAVKEKDKAQERINRRRAKRGEVPVEPEPDIGPAPAPATRSRRESADVDDEVA